MVTMKFSSIINADKQRVWEVLWNDETYKQWTAVFMEGSYAESDWKEGSSIQFLTPSGDGMYSVIEKKVDDEQMVFKHLGEIKNGVKEPKEWAGAREAYYLNDRDGQTELTIEMDSNGEMEKYFSETFPKALDVLKKIAEA